MQLENNIDTNNGHASTNHANRLSFLKIELLIAIRYLRARKKESFISLISWFSFIGIAIGVATLIIVMSVMNGFRQDLFDRILGFTGHITISSYSGSITDGESLVDQLKQQDKIAHARVLIDGTAIATANGRSHGVVIRALEAQEVATSKTPTSSNQTKLQTPGLNATVAPFALDDFKQDKGLLVGHHLYRNLALKRTDTITLIHPNGTQTAFGMVPRILGYRPLGPFKVGMYQYDSTAVLMPIKLAREFFDIDHDQVSAIEVFLHDPYHAFEVAQLIRQDLGNQYHVRDWERSNQSLVGALRVERNVMFVILTLIILVAAFNILASLIMLVHEKERSIAILRACGVGASSILRIFLICGSAIGLIGTMLGVGIGILFTLNIRSIQHAIEKLSGQDLFQEEIYFLSQLPAKLIWFDVGMICLMTLTLSIISALYPAIRAVRLQPIEILSHG